MNKLQTQVKIFHEHFGIVVNEEPTVPDFATRELRMRLILEELTELGRAFDSYDIVEIADAIGDLLYVVYGTAVSCGIEMDAITDEIHRSNMSKVGGHKDAGGKWIKPDTYSPCDLNAILVAQIKL